MLVKVRLPEQCDLTAGIQQRWYLNSVGTNAHVEDRNLTEREAIQLVKDFTADRARDEVEFYMGMIADEQQSFDGLVNHLKNAFQSGETVSELISNFHG